MRVHRNGGLWFIAIGRWRITVSRRSLSPKARRPRRGLYQGPPRYPVPTTAIDAIRYGVMACNVGVD